MYQVERIASVHLHGERNRHGENLRSAREVRSGDGAGRAFTILIEAEPAKYRGGGRRVGGAQGDKTLYFDETGLFGCEKRAIVALRMELSQDCIL